MNDPYRDNKQQAEQPHSLDDDRSTIQTEPTLGSHGRPYIRSGFDLLIECPRGKPSRRVPMCYSHMTIGSSKGPKSNDITIDEPGLANRQAILKLISSSLFFNNLNPSFETKVNDNPCAYHQLSPSDTITIGEHKITLLKLSHLVAHLEGYTDPHRKQHWTLAEPRTRLGRPGRRHNDIELLDPTVSRQHASILITEGQFVIQPDAKRPIWVNTEQVKGLRVLHDEDLIQIGQQLLRFRAYGAPPQPRALLPNQATILFSDIWNYTALAESRPLEESIGQLNEVYKRLGKVIVEHQGVLMTYLGDAMMAVFEAEGRSGNFGTKQHAELAVRSALSMLKALDELNRLWKTRGLPLLQIGIGIATGEVMVGDVGATGHREFAAMGDTTNVASRIEKLTRDHDAHLLINEETAHQIRHAFILKELGTVEVRGRRKPVRIFQVIEEKVSKPQA